MKEYGQTPRISQNKKKEKRHKTDSKIQMWQRVEGEAILERSGGEDMQNMRRRYKACFKRVQYDQGGHKGRRVLGREGDRFADNAQNSKRESKKRKGGEEVE